MFSSLQYGQSGLFLDDRCCLIARMEGADAGTDLSESSGLHRVTDRFGATTSTTEFKVGTSSGSFYLGTTNSNGYWVTYKENLECVMRDDFTVQYWLWLKSRAPLPHGGPLSNEYIRTFFRVGDGCQYAQGLWHFEDGRDDGLGHTGRFFFHSTDVNALYTTNLPSIQTWHHIAMCRYRKASTNKLTMEGWIDGVSIGTKDEDSFGITVTSYYGSSDKTGDFYVGPYTTLGATTNLEDIKSLFGDCYIDEFQILNGVALYRDGVTFTPPTYEL